MLAAALAKRKYVINHGLKSANSMDDVAHSQNFTVFEKLKMKDNGTGRWDSMLNC